MKIGKVEMAALSPLKVIKSAYWQLCQYIIHALLTALMLEESGLNIVASVAL